MKNFDIEKLERQNIYTKPDNFFQDLQEKVLQKTAPPKQAKVFKINWAYAAAAVVTMIFGMTFFLNQPVEEESTVARAQDFTAKTPSVHHLAEPARPTDATVNSQTLERNLTSAPAVHQKNNKEQPAVATKEKTGAAYQKKTNIQNPEVQVDQILANFTSAELADLGKNSEQDIYLDLYY